MHLRRVEGESREAAAGESGHSKTDIAIRGDVKASMHMVQRLSKQSVFWTSIINERFRGALPFAVWLYLSIPSVPHEFGLADCCAWRRQAPCCLLRNYAAILKLAKVKSSRDFADQCFRWLKGV